MIKRTVIDTSKIAAELAKSASKSAGKAAGSALKKTALTAKNTAQMTAGAVKDLAQFGVENLPELNDDISPQAFMEDMMKMIQSAAGLLLALAPGVGTFCNRFLPGKFASIQRNVVRNTAKKFGIDATVGGQRQGQKQDFLFKIPQGLAPKARPNLGLKRR